MDIAKILENLTYFPDITGYYNKAAEKYSSDIAQHAVRVIQQPNASDRVLFFLVSRPTEFHSYRLSSHMFAKLNDGARCAISSGMAVLALDPGIVLVVVVFDDITLGSRDIPFFMWRGFVKARD
jgi:hypothetical protein